MEEARQAWATLKSSISLNAGNGNVDQSNANSSTIWYDAPAPVIVHCREFRDAIETDGEKPVDGNDPPDGRNEAKKRGGERRHRNTVELTAVASVRTDADGGVPKISFSFLRADKKCETFPRAAMADENDREHAFAQNELYDFPRNSCVCDEIESEKVVESERETEVDGEQIRGTILPKLESVTRDLGNEIEEKAGPPVENSLRGAEESSTSEKATSRDPSRRSTRSLRHEKKVRITAATSGYYSDPERRNGSQVVAITNFPPKNGTEARGAGQHSSTSLVACSRSPSVSARTKQRRNCSTNPRQSQQKRRLGKAWEKMRSWLRDETFKINVVVNKHARLQAVGALARHESRTLATSKGNHNHSGSYDLTDARPRESGSITRIEEFGLPTGPKENSFSSGSSSSSSPFSPPPLPLPPPLPPSPSSDPISPIKDRSTSFDARKLYSDTEIEEADNVAAENENRDHARKAGLIKRRMLGSIRGLMASTHLLHVLEPEEAGQGGFEDVRRYVKQGGDFCKELASILHERAELEATYAKGLSKLSSKLTKACAKDQGGNSGGGVNEAWRCVGEEMEAAAEAHRIWGMTLGEQLAKPIRVGVAEAQGRSRKSIENSVDKAGKSLHEWRNVATKSKKQSFACARENERLQDLARLQSISQQSQQANNKSSNHHMTEKEASKLETRRRKAEDSSRRADMEFYTVSVRAERARLEYESTVRKGAKQMELLEEERLSALKDLANVYLAHLQTLAPRLQQSADRLTAPIRNCNVSQDIEILKNLIRRVESNDGSNSEQLLPDFYAEHVTLAMNRERRKQALVRVLHLIRQDLERERRGREGLETLHRAFVATPAFAADESTQNVTEKLHHMRSMLLYLEAARYKVGGTLTEVEGSKRAKHPLAEHILVSRDKQGLQQSVLKIPSWAKNESFEVHDDDDDHDDDHDHDHDEDEIDVQLAKDHDTESRHWTDRTAGDGNSENPPDEDDFSDFDEFSSQSEDNNNVDTVDTVSKSDETEQCRAIYQYSANLNDELSLSPGDLITVHQKQPDGWWIGECRGRTGIFPATYVQVIR